MELFMPIKILGLGKLEKFQWTGGSPVLSNIYNYQKHWPQKPENELPGISHMDVRQNEHSLAAWWLPAPCRQSTAEESRSSAGTLSLPAVLPWHCGWHDAGWWSVWTTTWIGCSHWRDCSAYASFIWAHQTISPSEIRKSFMLTM